MFGSLRRFSLVLNAFIAGPFGLQRTQSMTRQTVYLRPVSKWRTASSTASPPTQPVVRRGRPAALSDARDGRHLSDTSGRGQLPCSRGYRVESLISRICGSSPREWPFHIAPSAPQELLSAINPLEFACANRVRNGRSDRCLV
jgi:hypothetical protein